jgi:hypothetical protein
MLKQGKSGNPGNNAVSVCHVEQGFFGETRSKKSCAKEISKEQTFSLFLSPSQGDQMRL